jgi:hypothetical protein
VAIRCFPSNEGLNTGLRQLRLSRISRLDAWVKDYQSLIRDIAEWQGQEKVDTFTREDCVKVSRFLAQAEGLSTSLKAIGLNLAQDEDGSVFALARDLINWLAVLLTHPGLMNSPSTLKTPCTVIHGRRLRSWLNCIVEPKAGFLFLCVAAGPRIDPNATNAILAGMLGVSAMAVQNTLVQISLKGAPSTAVMTSNVTRFAIDVGEVLLGGDPADVARARSRAARTLPPIVGFTAGCGLGAACEAAVGTWTLALPAGLALLAFATGFAAEPDDGPH